MRVYSNISLQVCIVYFGARERSAKLMLACVYVSAYVVCILLEKKLAILWAAIFDSGQKRKI